MSRASFSQQPNSPFNKQIALYESTRLAFLSDVERLRTSTEIGLRDTRNQIDSLHAVIRDDIKDLKATITKVDTDAQITSKEFSNLKDTFNDFEATNSKEWKGMTAANSKE